MSDIIHKVKMEYNGFKLELEGEREFVDEKIGNMGELLERVLSTPKTILIEDKTNANPQLSEAIDSKSDFVKDESSISIREFLNSKNFVTDVDIVCGIAFYLMHYRNLEDFSKTEVEDYMRQAKYQIPSNISMSFSRNVTKGNFQESDKAYPKRYYLTDTGDKYISSFVGGETKEKPKAAKPKKPKAQQPSIYQSLTREQLCLDKYPSIKSLEKFKEKMIMAMYIITKENKGEYFSVNDLTYIMTNIFGEKATKDQINGVFKRETDWFNKKPNEKNNKEVIFKLLNKAEQFAESFL